MSKSHYFCSECGDSTQITQIIKEEDKLSIRILPGACPFTISKKKDTINKTCHIKCDKELKDIISKFPTHKKDISQINNIEISCSICTSDKDEFILLPCFHLYCKECILKWNEQKPEELLNFHGKKETDCPECRQKLNHSNNPFKGIKRLHSQAVSGNKDNNSFRNYSLPLKKMEELTLCEHFYSKIFRYSHYQSISEN